MSEAKKFSTSVNLVDGIDLTFSCDEQMDYYTYGENVPNGKYKLYLDLHMCDKDALDGDVEVKLPNGSELEYSSIDGGWMRLTMNNGLCIYQEFSEVEKP